MLAWGARVSAEFRSIVMTMGEDLAADPSWLMACMAFETGEKFSANVKNGAGSGAVGLIQFMPPTAAALGTTPEELADMTPERQLRFVEQYLTPWSCHPGYHSLGDVYGAILWPSMIGKPDTAVIFDGKDQNHPKLYLQNRGLDLNHDGLITKAEIVSRVQQELTRGLLPANSMEMA